MSGQTPVVLVSLPNLPYLLGTFDTARFRNWWRSAPFPDELDTIKKGFHIYGRTHLSIAKRTDGRWAIYRSKNYGIDWERAFLAAAGETIYDLVLITYGRAIMNTSAGFYETVNAGKSWTKIANLPGASTVPAFCNIGGGDILLCTDGRYIWRSTDIARHWTQVCDQQGLTRAVPGRHFTPPLPSDWGGYTGYNFITYTGLTHSCIAGANGYVVCGFGPHMTISEDSGLTWTAMDHHWEYAAFPSDVPLKEYPRPTLYHVWNRFVPASPPQFIIREIIVSSVDGNRPTDVTFLLKYDDLYPMDGETLLYSRVFKSRATGDYLAWDYIFQQYLSPTDTASQLSAYDSPVTGESYNDKLAFSAQTRVDSSGNLVPSLKYSINGGKDWIDIDVSKLKVGTVDGAPLFGGSALDDNFAKITWVHGGCDNTGSWNVVEEYRRQTLSYEMDVNLGADRSESYIVDTLASSDKQVTEDVDAILANPKQKVAYDVDAMAEGRASKSYLIDRTLEGLVSKEQEVDAILSIDHQALDTLDAHVWAHLKKYYHVDVLFKSRRSQTYAVDAIIVKDELTQTMQDMVAKIPQFMDVMDPGLPYEVYNSRRAST